MVSYLKAPHVFKSIAALSSAATAFTRRSEGRGERRSRAPGGLLFSGSLCFQCVPLRTFFSSPFTELRSQGAPKRPVRRTDRTRAWQTCITRDLGLDDDKWQRKQCLRDLASTHVFHVRIYIDWNSLTPDKTWLILNNEIAWNYAIKINRALLKLFHIHVCYSLIFGISQSVCDTSFFFRLKIIPYI